MISDELYCKGARVWIPDPDEVWIGASLLEDWKPGQTTLSLETEDSLEQRQVKVPTKDKLPPLRNPDILIGENDLTSMSYLNEPEVLYNLQVRFADRNCIYTYCGIVLVAINPYDDLPIYGNEIVQAYNGQDSNNLDPHIYAVAEEAFKQMSRFEQNQSIIVSGESGAGKTVSAKYAMRYFAIVGGSSSDETQVEKKVLASNPIMEAIGNAKTTRNDNSSRFGKYIEIDFKKDLTIIGAQMRTYLLEKSRVVFQAADERNYHIFYQLCASRDEEEFAELGLSEPEDFSYLNNGDCTEIDGVDDAKELNSTKQALDILGINDVTQNAIFKVFAAVLHLGNIALTERTGDSSKVPSNDKGLKAFCTLLGIDEEQTNKWLCNRQIQTVGETLTKPLTVPQASFSRDALAKHIYSETFQYIVTQINKSLACKEKSTSFIGVLDIYGFETFEINSFEQFCINYANEKLQQQFNLHVFKLEQEEYVREKIEWSMIDFYDNQPCIDLIEAKLGILDLLDEECKVPNGSDGNWCTKMYDRLTKNKHFQKPKTSRTAFIIDHFADKVQYETDGFLDKNRDAVLETQLKILRASNVEFVADLFIDKTDGAPGSTAGGKKKAVQVRAGQKQPKSASKASKQTVGNQFRESLKSLMTTLFSTTPHYVRCIKPNDEKAAFTFDSTRAVQQLRACGVLETIRISAAGYPSRWTYPEFFQRYRVLCKQKQLKRNDIRTMCEKVLDTLINDTDKYQFGKTKIFFRAGQVAYLEKLRSDKLQACGIMIQKHVKGWIYKKKYLAIRKTTLLLQIYARGYLARKHAQFLRETRAAIRIQKIFRGFSCRKSYSVHRNAIIKIQALARGILARRRYNELLRDVKATTIQKHVRRWLQVKKYRMVLRGIVLIQSHYRRRKARLLFKVLKIEAKSVDHIKKVNKGLENKIIELQQKIEDMKKTKKDFDNDRSKLETMQKEVEKLKGSEEGLKSASSKITDLEELVARLRAELEKERNEKEVLIEEKIVFVSTTALKQQELEESNAEQKVLIARLEQEMAEMQSKMQADLNMKLDQERKQVIQEMSVEREHHQRLVKEHGRLQQRMENLVEERNAKMSSGHARHPSDVSSVSLDSSVPDSGINFPDEVRQNNESDYDSLRRRQKFESTESPLAVKEKGTDEASTEDKSETIGDDRETTLSVGDVRENDIDATQKSTADPEQKPAPVDIGMMLKLQSRIRDLEKERNQLLKERESVEQRPRTESQYSDIAVDHQRLIELEMENGRLKEGLERLQKAVAQGEGGSTELTSQFTAVNDELARRREECIQLKSVLANRAKDSIETAKQSYGGHAEILNEDGELASAYQTLKDVNRVLQRDLEQEKIMYKKREVELRGQIDELKRDNDRQQDLIGQISHPVPIPAAVDEEPQNLSMSPEQAMQNALQFEIQRLMSENLDLREKCDHLEEKVRKLKKAVKVYANRLKEGEDKGKGDVTIEDEEEEDMGGKIKYQPTKHYMGLLEYKKEEESTLIRHLVTELKPRVAITLIPTLPAYIVFMCLRYTDHLNEDSRCKTLLTNIINGIKKVSKSHQDDLETLIVWLANTCRFLHLLKQYSGEKVFQIENTEMQNSHSLRNFDLSEYRSILSDLGVWLYQGLVKVCKDQVHPLIVGALLEYEGIQGLSSKPLMSRQRSSSHGDVIDVPTSPEHCFENLIKLLTSWVNLVRTHGFDTPVVSQLFKQIFYFIVATATNNLLLRKDMCNWSKGMQIRYNLSNLEQWLRDNRLHECGAVEVMEPLIQASQLLQARKSVEDVDSICEMCSQLSVAQIIKILNLYTPVDEYEERVPISFIRKIQHMLKEKRKSDQSSNPQALLIDTKHFFSVTFPFCPSSIGLESVDIPSVLKLPFLVRL